MRKYVIGTIFGALLTFSVTAYGEEVKNLVGEAIQGTFPVRVNGETLTNQAIVVDGTSYLPVREFGEKLGMDVKFDADMGIELTKKFENTPTTTQVPDEQSKLTIEQIELSIESAKGELETLENQLPIVKNENLPKLQVRISEVKTQISELEQLKAQLEAQKAELTK